MSFGYKDRPDARPLAGSNQTTGREIQPSGSPISKMAGESSVPNIDSSELYTVEDKDTVGGNLGTYTDFDTPLMKRIAQQGRANAASRGLTNSSIAGRGAMGNMLDKAGEFATTDAAAYNARKTENARTATQRYTTDETVKANKYSDDKRLEGTKYTSDSSAASSKYTSDKNLEGAKYTSDKNLEGSKYGDDKNLEGNKYTADSSADASKYNAELNLEGSKYGDDKNLEGQKYNADSNLEGQKYGADQALAGDNVRASATVMAANANAAATTQAAATAARARVESQGLAATSNEKIQAAQGEIDVARIDADKLLNTQNNTAKVKAASALAATREAEAAALTLTNRASAGKAAKNNAVISAGNGYTQGVAAINIEASPGSQAEQLQRVQDAYDNEIDAIESMVF